ncbi:hypothetical protein [Luteipulveratus halotolerans]|uniref:Uncharacterized protein n=1 Tax=Luteipulveratus halotolerans TaxID=1631356 RepID=A0A0L6CL73_9MICO|nr:hypothetical protein [Luteipulveratus halotolerans]KNX38541.1 hypothetical protein VV01_17535 [Luteipulveratus halotolerans]
MGGLSRWQRAYVTLAIGMCLVGAFLLAVLASSLIGPAYPGRDRLPDLPAGLHASGGDLECASAGCWRTWTIRAQPSLSGPDTLERLGGLRESCGHYGWFDWRESCTRYRLGGADGAATVTVSVAETLLDPSP